MTDLEARCKKAVEVFGWEAAELDDIRLFYRFWKRTGTGERLIDGALKRIGM